MNTGDEIEIKLDGEWRRAAVVNVYEEEDLYHFNVEGVGSTFLDKERVDDGDFEVRPYTPTPRDIVASGAGMTKEAWDEALDKNPLDWELRADYADWLEEVGCLWLMDGQRYQIRNKMTPGPACVHEASWHEATWFADSMAGHKWCLFGNQAAEIRQEWCVPQGVFINLRRHVLHRLDGGSHNRFAKSWRGRREAEVELAVALTCQKKRRSIDDPWVRS